MKKLLSLICIMLALVGVLSGCSDKKSLEQEKQALQNEIKILKEELNNKEEKFEKEIETRNELDKKGYEILNAMKNKNIDFLKTQLSKETVCLGDRIRDKSGWEYVFPKNNEELGRRQAYWINEGEVFIMGYYIEEIASKGHSSLRMQEEYTYRLEDNEWKLYTVHTQ